MYYVSTCRVGGVGQLLLISSTKSNQLVTILRNKVVWGEGHCVLKWCFTQMFLGNQDATLK